MPQGALRRQDMQALGSPTVDLRGELIYRGLSSDRAGRLRSIRTSKFSSKSIFLLCGKCAICDFPSETSTTPLPPFRNALRLEKKCELMRCSLNRSSRVFCVNHTCICMAMRQRTIHRVQVQGKGKGCHSASSQSRCLGPLQYMHFQNMHFTR